MTAELHTALFGWARTGDEDVYESSGALLPVTAGAYIGNADHRTKQIGGVNISSHVATLFRALHQFVDCSLDLAARTLIEPGRDSGNAVESGRNNMLCRDVIDKQQQPGTQGLDRGHRGGEPARCRGQLLHLTPIDRFDQRIPCREMAVQGTGSNTRLLRDVVQTGSRAVAREGPLRHFENSLAVAQSIRSRLSLGSLGMFLHFQNFLQPETISDYLLTRRLSPF
jgi:hypothetical protein